jgi:hypothetical protein
MTMINVDLSQQEFDLILNYRQGIYKLDITKEEFEMISRFREQEMTPATKYLQNVEKLMFDENDLVRKCAKTLKQFSESLLDGRLSLEEYNSRPYFEFTDQEKEVTDKTDNLNYLRDQISFHFENGNK